MISGWQQPIKFLVAGASLYFVGTKLWQDKAYLATTARQLQGADLWFMALALFLLMLLNWGLEARKWQLIAILVKQLSFVEACKTIVAGVSLDAILPFGAGAVSSKVLSLHSRHRRQLLATVIVAQGLQSVFTVLFGVVGLFTVAAHIPFTKHYNWVATLAPIMAVVAGLLAYLYLPVLKHQCKESIRTIGITNWWRIAGLSLGRYLVFFIQMLLAGAYLAPYIPTQVLAGCITFMFLAKTLVPKPGHLGALGIRGASIIFYLHWAGFQPAGVVLASVVVWAINLAIPSLIGLIYINKLNFKTVRN